MTTARPPPRHHGHTHGKGKESERTFRTYLLCDNAATGHATQQLALSWRVQHSLRRLRQLGRGCEVDTSKANPKHKGA
jgi:hypothetical protein